MKKEHKVAESSVGIVKREDIAGMTELPHFTTSAPFDLHRIKDTPTFFDGEPEIKSNNQLSRITPRCDCCQTIDGTRVPQKGVSWECNNWKHVRGISTFSPLDSKVMKAAHCLFDVKGAPLNCFILPLGTEISNTAYLFDRYIRSEGSSVARHVLIYPSESDGILKGTFEKIGLCEEPSDIWTVCRFVAEAESDPKYEYPDAPDDQLVSNATFALENYVALNCSVPGNIRRHARILQYYLSTKNWEDLEESDPYENQLVLYALELWLEDESNGLSISIYGNVRSMMGSLKSWISQQDPDFSGQSMSEFMYVIIGTTRLSKEEEKSVVNRFDEELADKLRNLIEADSPMSISVSCGSSIDFVVRTQLKLFALKQNQILFFFDGKSFEINLQLIPNPEIILEPLATGNILNADQYSPDSDNIILIGVPECPSQCIAVPISKSHRVRVKRGSCQCYGYRLSDQGRCRNRKRLISNQIVWCHMLAEQENIYANFTKGEIDSNFEAPHWWFI